MSDVRLVDLRETTLDVAEVIDAVSDASFGGVAVFVGRVRDHDEGRSVTGLEYSAHPTALAKLREVAEDVAARHPGVAVATTHRVGQLDLGDLAVVVAAGAPHRDAAYDASRALIDELKQTVPIWKHQRFSDGTDEWVGTP